MTTRSQRAAAALTLVSLPDDALLMVLAACAHAETLDFCDHLPLFDGLPLFEAVKGLGCVSKGMRQQLHRLQPLVGVRSLAVVKRPTHGPWRVTLIYEGKLTKAVMEQARHGRVRWINTSDLAPAVARRVVPELLGAGCSLLYLNLSHLPLVGLGRSWAACFGQAAVCSAVLRRLILVKIGLRGPLPELRLPALQVLHLHANQLMGGLEPLRDCTALRDLNLRGHKLNANKLTGGLEPLRGCTALQKLELGSNQLTGGLEPLQGCTALEMLFLEDNQLSGGLEPLRGCTALENLFLEDNQLSGGLEPLRGCTALVTLQLKSNHLAGSLGPLRGCSALEVLELDGNQLVPSDEDKAHFKAQCDWEENVEEDDNSGYGGGGDGSDAQTSCNMQ